MPTYSYRCAQGHEFEEFQSIVADPLHVCPQCGAPVERVISGGTGLIFKGSGFYITDYTKKSGEQKGSTAKSTKPESSSSTDAQPAAKSESANASSSAGPAKT